MFRTAALFASREKAIQENLQIFLNCNYKKIFPLKMPKAKQRAFKIIPA